MLPLKTMVIFNPVANRGHGGEIEDCLKNCLPKPNEIIWERTDKAGDAQRIAVKAVQRGFKRIIAIGGDGTTAEIVNGMMRYPKSKRPILGIVPIGSGNDFAAGLGIPPEPKEAMYQALHGTSQPVDIGMLKTNYSPLHYWVNAVGIGFDAVVNIHSRNMKVFSGFGLYLASALKTILQNHIPYHVIGKIDKQTWDKKFLMLVISNGKREGGGFKIAPHAQLNDGYLNFVGVMEISRLRMLITLLYFLQGKQEQLPYVESGLLNKMEITTDHPMQIHADGEVIAGFDSNITSLQIQVLPSVIEVAY